MPRKTAKGPLRKVVREFSKERHVYMLGIVYDHYEELECGHVMRPRKDIHGEYFASRRRCSQCAAQQSVQLTDGGRAQIEVESVAAIGN